MLRPEQHPCRSGRDKKTLRSLTALLLLALLNSEPAWSSEHDHGQPVSLNETLQLATLLDSAVASHPYRQMVQARTETARAWDSQAQGWLSAAPAASLRYQSDQFQDNDGLEEWEAGLELPLWRWGQRTRVRNHAQELGQLATTADGLLRWQLAGQLREQFWGLALASSGQDLAQGMLKSDTALAALIEKRYNAGESTRADNLLAQSERNASRLALLDAEARVIDLERSFQSLTGSSHHPPFIPEALSTLSSIPTDHPLLAYADGLIQEAQGYQEVVADSVKSAPTLLLGPRREKAVADDNFDDSIGLTLRLPLASKRHTAVSRSEAAYAAAEARSSRDMELRQLLLTFHEVRHELDLTRERIAIATQQNRFTEARESMAQIGHDQGEASLLELLRERRQAARTRQSLTELKLKENMLIAMYNQAVGVLP